MRIFEVTKWGPKKLREILEQIQNAINDRTPTAGIGIECDESENGIQINLSAAQTGTPEDSKGGTGVSSGTAVDIYGALNGFPALYHLLQSSPPTPVT